MEIGTTTWSEFLNGGKATVGKILESEDKNKSKSTWLWETGKVRNPSSKSNNRSKVVLIKIL